MVQTLPKGFSWGVGAPPRVAGELLAFEISFMGHRGEHGASFREISLFVGLGGLVTGRKWRILEKAALLVS